MARKVTVQGNYQYSEANIKQAMLLHSFGWLIGRRTEHENKKGEKVFTIRRDLQIASDGFVRKAEKKFNAYHNKAQKKMKCRHRWGLFFAILFTVIGAAAGACFMLADMLEPLGDIINPIKDTVEDLLLQYNVGEDIVALIMDYIPYAFFGIAGISLIFIFINGARYKKRLAVPKRKYARKYNAIAQSALKEGNDRVYALKAENRYLMTGNDRKLADLGATFQRLMDRNVDEYE